MISKLKYNKDIESELPLDYFLIEKIKISRGKGNKRINYYKNIEKHFALITHRYSPSKPISKLLDPNDF